ncbi:tetratricopeptide repeat protein [Thiotrichales bacterium 19S9-12]|nr:tetratricopeptide repeat protein [Thiotrichales bacterium 19S9-11]MCF6810906.1 tetratricopeptide repeat protein [Thiotrichales bacterium 19S9-12]
MAKPLTEIAKLYEAGNFTDAKLSLVEFLEEQPEHDLANNLLGIVYYHLKDIDLSKKHLEKAIEINPNLIDAYSNLGRVLAEGESFDQAKDVLNKALEVDPSFASAYFNLGVIEVNCGHDKKALDLFKKVVTLNPKHALAIYHIGGLMSKYQQYDKAIRCYDEVLSINSNYDGAYLCLGLLYVKKKDYKKAENYFSKCIELNPNNAEPYFNLGILASEAYQPIKAINYYEKAIEVDSKHFKSYSNLAVAKHLLGDVSKAEELFKEALKLEPSNEKILFNYSILLLTQFDFTKGFDLYRNRFSPNVNDPNTFYQPKTDKPYYNGENLENKTIYIYHEQGVGDMIMFARFIQYLIEQKANVIIYINKHQGLYSLFKRSFPKASIVKKEYKKDYDYHIAMMDLGYALKLNHKNIPYTNGYLKPSLKKKKFFKTKVNQSKKKLAIGIAWKGKSIYPNDHYRSMDLEVMLNKLNIKLPYKLYSLQKDLTEEEVNLLKKYKINDLSQYCNDFLDTASAMTNLDFVISVDTAIAHLSSALGIETLVLLSAYQIEWRWGLANQSTSSYWYDHNHLIWQKEKGNWPLALEQIDAKIKSIVKSRDK